MTEGRTPIDVMDAVTRSRGKEAINPFKIDGAPEMRSDGAFSDEDPAYPAPEGSFGHIPSYLDETMARVQGAMPPSPLVPPSVTSMGTAVEQPVMPQQPNLANVRLMVVDSEAVVHGQAIPLDDMAQKQIMVICLRSQQRQTDNLLATLEAPKPARRQTKPALSATPSKRRGRPKGSKNKPKEPDAPGLDPDQAAE